MVGPKFGLKLTMIGQLWANFRPNFGSTSGQLQAHWNGNPAELEREKDDIDKKDHEAMYTKVDDDYPDNMLDLQESDSVNTSVYDRLGATPASTTISTDTEAASDMLNLTMGPLELLACQEANNLVEDSDDVNPLVDMFKVPAEGLVPQDPLPAKPQLDPRALMAKVKFK